MRYDTRHDMALYVTSHPRSCVDLKRDGRLIIDVKIRSRTFPTDSGSFA